MALLNKQSKSQAVAPFYFQLKGGIVNANLNLKFTNLDKSKQGLFAGGALGIKLTPQVNLQPELLYTAKGGSMPYKLNDWFSGKISLQLRYLEAPVALHVRITNGVSVHAGGYAAHLLQARAAHNSPLPFINISGKLPSSWFNRLDYGALAGAEIKLQNFVLGARYNYGLRPVDGTIDLLGTNYQILNARNTNYQLYLGINF